MDYHTPGLRDKNDFCQNYKTQTVKHVLTILGHIKICQSTTLKGQIILSVIIIYSIAVLLF